MSNNSKLLKELMYEEPIGTWFQADFHVHSQTSPDYFVSKETEDPYLELLQQAKNSNIRIICIADHNDIRGYYHLQEIEKEVKGVKEGLQKREIPVPEQIMEQVGLFDHVIYLPGVELDVYPNIHLVIIFDPTDTEEAISSFLTKAGYPPNIRGDETAARNASWKFTQAIEEAANIGAISIAAHIDSTKGLYEESKSWGQTRIDAFTHPSLSAMEFLKTSSRDQIISLLNGDPNYQRKTPLAFIQSSDFHGKPGQKIGDKRTFIRIDHLSASDKKKTFDDIKLAFQNPDEYISAPESPHVSTILEKLKNVPFVEDIDTPENTHQIYRYVCAYANSEDGTIVIGRNKKGNWAGIYIEKPEEFPAFMDSLIKANVYPEISRAIGIYEYSKDRYICTIRVQKHQKVHIVSEEDKAYIIENGKLIPLFSNELVELAEANLINRYTHLSISNRISEITSRLSGLQDTIDILSMVKKLETKTIKFVNVYKPPAFGGIITPELQEHVELSANGSPNGNIIIIPSKANPRFESHYLRITAPIGKCDEQTYTHEEKFRFSGPKIIISPGGGVFFDDHNDILVYGIVWEPAVFTELRQENYIDHIYIAAYLKSAISIWFTERCLGSIDIRSISTIKKVLIPQNSSGPIAQKIIQNTNALLNLERDYLELETRITANIDAAKQQDEPLEEWFRELEKAVTKHNESAAAYMAKIDQLFFEEFEFSDSEIEIIQNGIKTYKLATFYDREMSNKDMINPDIQKELT